jgi:16S rRNA processing protein RimM
MKSSSPIVIGKIISTHGIKGWVSIDCYAYPPENLKSYKTFLEDNHTKEIRILDIKIMPKKIIIKIENFDDINISEKILGKNILVNNNSIPSLELGDYYWKDLIGLRVLTTKNEHLGIVDFIFNNGSNDVLAIKNSNKSISYIAFIKKNISKIDNDKIIMCDESV